MNSKSKVLIVAAFTLTAGMSAANLVQAEQDFSQYSNEELVRLRSQVHNMNETDRVQFQQELHLRAQKMNSNERAFLGLENKAEQDQLRQRINEDNTRGRGDLIRERQRIENDSGYGRGFGSRQAVPGAGGGSGRGR